MADVRDEEILNAVEEIFGDRMKRRPLGEGETSVENALALVSPTNALEVELLSEVAGRFSVPLAGLGAQMASGPAAQSRSILVRFDLMSGMKFLGSDESWVEVEPGATLLSLENNLEARGAGLAVYPTSAPRATVGGWLMMDGLGVGSFEYGWLSENVLSAEVVLPGGERREVRGEELLPLVQTEDTRGIVVGATLRTRRADTDVPFGSAFDDPEDLVRTIADIQEAGVPLWHVAFLDPGMAHARNSGEDYLLFGAYPGERAASVEEALQGAFKSHRGRVLPAAETYRVWGERFFPMAPSRPVPASMERMLVPLAETTRALVSTRDRSANIALQGTVARTGEVLILTFDAQKEGWAM